MKTFLSEGRSGRPFVAVVSIYENSVTMERADNGNGRQWQTMADWSCLADLPTPNLCFSSHFGHFTVLLGQVVTIIFSSKLIFPPAITMPFGKLIPNLT